MLVDRTSFLHPSALLQHSHGGMEQRDREKSPCLQPIFPSKWALFAALTGHEYQAEGAGGATDAHGRAAGTF